MTLLRSASSAVQTTYTLSVPYRLSADGVAHRCGLHPDLVRRLAALSLVDTTRDASGQLWFSPDAPATIARVQRLHAVLPLNYAAIGLVMDLLDRIDALETALRRAGLPRPRGDAPIEQARSETPWT